MRREDKSVVDSDETISFFFFPHPPGRRVDSRGSRRLVIDKTRKRDRGILPFFLFRGARAGNSAPRGTRGNGEKTSGREQTGSSGKTRRVIFERFISVLFQRRGRTLAGRARCGILD